MVQDLENGPSFRPVCVIDSKGDSDLGRSMDGLPVYGGMDMLENMVILTGSIDRVTVLWAFVRGFGAARMHSACTSLVGRGISYVHKRRKLFYCGTLSLLIVAIIIHALFNTLIQSQYKRVAYLAIFAMYIPQLSLPWKRISASISTITSLTPIFPFPPWRTISACPAKWWATCAKTASATSAWYASPKPRSLTSLQLPPSQIPCSPASKKPVQDNMDLDSILEDFFKEFPPESGKGGAS